MDGASVLLFVFVLFCLMLGYCLARIRGISREIDGLKSVVGLVGSVQREAAKQTSPKVDYSALLAAVKGAEDEQ